MRLAASNIAWATEERQDAYRALSDAGFQGLEIAPGLFLGAAADPIDPPEQVLRAAMAEVHDFGLALVSMQSLLFGVEGAALFGDVDERARFTHGMSRAVTLAGRLGIPNLVFGSPRQRIVPDGMQPQQARELAIETFRALGDQALAAGTVISIEPNPAQYGTNFLNTLQAAAEFVDAVDHAGITLILDLGAMHMNDAYSALPDILLRMTTLISHVHVSEPHLGPAPDPATDLMPLFEALQSRSYVGAVSIEMRRPQDGLAGLAPCLSRLAASAELVVGA